MAESELFTREEALAGLPAKRARTLLFQIERQVARREFQACQATQRYPAEQDDQAFELAFLEAYALDGAPPVQPTIQDIERYAHDWACNVPENDNLRAALAHALGEKFHFTAQDIPAIRQALALDQAGVQEAYQRQYQRPLDVIYANQPDWTQRLRWSWSRFQGWLDRLPPFWTAYALTFTETVGGSILALPIAFAQIGALGGIALLLFFGLVNILTIHYVAEALTRSGSVRYENAYFGRLVFEYLGSAGSTLFTVALVILNIMALLAYNIGLSKTLHDVTRLPAWLWSAVLFVTILFFLRRKTLNATIASALVVGVINICLLLSLSVLGLLHLQPQHFLASGLTAVQAFDPGMLSLAFGVVFTAYFGHTTVASGARTVLRRDPSGRSLISGSVAAQVSAMLLYILWVLAINGATPAELLANQTGTALTPLADIAGPLVHVFGSLYIILGMGMAAILFSLGTQNLIRERLPNKFTRVLSLPRQSGQLLFRLPGSQSGGFHLDLSYAGLENHLPLLAISIQDGTEQQRFEIPLDATWDISLLYERLPRLKRYNQQLRLEKLHANHENLRLRVVSTLKVSASTVALPTHAFMTDVMELHPEQRQVIQWLLKNRNPGMDELRVLAADSQINLHSVLRKLITDGLVSEILDNGASRYRVNLTARPRSSLSKELWDVIDKVEKGRHTNNHGRMQESLAGRFWNWLVGERNHFAISVLPILFVFLLTEWLLLTGMESFTAPISFAGVLIISLLSGVFPVLLLIASRRKGEMVPGVAYRWLSHPILLGSIYTLSLGNLFLHGLVIWQHPVERAVAILMGILTIVATLLMMARRVFTPRLAIELRREMTAPHLARLELVYNGQPTLAEVGLHYKHGEVTPLKAGNEITEYSKLSAIRLQSRGAPAGEVKVWAHQVGLDGESKPIPYTLMARCGEGVTELHLRVNSGKALFTNNGAPCQVEIKVS